jgi:hypothetical protein
VRIAVLDWASYRLKVMSIAMVPPAGTWSGKFSIAVYVGTTGLVAAATGDTPPRLVAKPAIAFLQNLRRGHYGLATETPRRL